MSDRLETVYLHTWGSRRHIADDVDADGVGLALCGQVAYTEERRFRGSTPSRRKRAGILNRPICANCLALRPPTPASSVPNERRALPCEHGYGGDPARCDECAPILDAHAPSGEGTERPGGWVEGIGWVALLHDVVGLDAWVTDDAQPVSPEGWTCYGKRAVEANRPVIVQQWADGEIPDRPAPSTPTPPAPGRPLVDGPEPEPER